MGPFPHTAPRSEISEANPIGTDGFEFVEFTHDEPEVKHWMFRPLSGSADHCCILLISTETMPLPMMKSSIGLAIPTRIQLA